MSELIIVIVTILTAAGACALVVCCIEFFEWRSSHKYAQTTGRDTKYILFDGLYIEGDDGVWYTRKEFTQCLVSKFSADKIASEIEDFKLTLEEVLENKNGNKTSV